MQAPSKATEDSANSPASVAHPQIAHYLVSARIGKGGMGEVWSATDTKLGREVAIKLLPGIFAGDPVRLARVRREAQLLASLNHPGIAAIYGIEEVAENGAPALVMELVEGPTLADRIAAGPIPIDEALPILRQIAEALEFAHERGIVHRDLKPANIKITPQGQVKVLDFGLAKAMGPDEASADISNSPTLSVAMTEAGLLLGTAAYMAPEQAKAKHVDRRADIWAFGCVAYEMLTGHKAFEGETISDVLAAILKDEPDWSALPVATPVSMQRLLRRCLQKDVRQRLQAMGDARIAIEETLAGGAGGGLSSEIAASQPAVSGKKRLLRRALPWALGGIAVLSAAIAAWLLLQPKPAGRERLGKHAADISVERSEQVCDRNFFKFSVGDKPDLLAVGRPERAVAASGGGANGTDLWALPLFGDRKPFALVQGSNYGAHSARFSPNGRFVAYDSNETGKMEIYVQTFPQQTGKWQISPSGGLESFWRRDGKELFYLTPDNQLMAVPINTDAASFQPGIPKPLFQTTLVPISTWKNIYVPSPDGQRFLMLTPEGQAKPEPITVVVNWPSQIEHNGGQ
jgi:serine/threonine-protein kinase